jgi:hypothetical protein
MANVTAERLRDLIGADLDALEAIVHWNQAHGIEVFRLTSNLIPFGSPPRTSSRGERTRSPPAALDRATVARQSTPPDSGSCAVLNCAGGQREARSRFTCREGGG